MSEVKVQHSHYMNKPTSKVLLTKDFTSRTNGKETRLIIKGNYCPLTGSVEILMVLAEVANYMQWGNTFTYTSPTSTLDLTEIFNSDLPFTLDGWEDGQEINWSELYYNHTAEKECVA